MTKRHEILIIAKNKNGIVSRIMSIFRKLKENGVSYDRDYNLLSDGLNSNERELATALLKFPYWIIKS